MEDCAKAATPMIQVRLTKAPNDYKYDKDQLKKYLSLLGELMPWTTLRGKGFCKNDDQTHLGQVSLYQGSDSTGRYCFGVQKYGSK